MDFSGNYSQHYLSELNRIGFCSMKVFTDEHIEKLRHLYALHYGEKEVKGLYATHNSSPAEKAMDISTHIKDIVNGTLQNIFPEHEYFIGHFMVKAAHEQNEFSLHQDWGIVDELKHTSYQIWIPLQITYPANGGMFVVPGSHKFFNNYRSGSYGIPVVPYDEVVETLVTDIIVPPGNVLVYHNALFHASHPNKTNMDRLAVIVNFVERNAATYYFQKNKEQPQTDLFAIDGEILLNHLPQLEKGIVDISLENKGSSAPNTVDNKNITSTDLKNKFHAMFGSHARGSQVKQWHIAGHELEEKLNKDGYAVIDLLNAETVGKLVKEYNKHFGNIDRSPGRFMTLQHTDTATKNGMHRFINETVEDSLNQYFSDYIIPVSLYYTKKAFTSGDIDLHADTTLLLNHQLEPHYAIWVPLVDVNENNGTLTVVPKSHLIQSAFFGGSIGGYHLEHMDWLKQFEIPIPLKAGQAVIFDNNLLHNSTANKTAEDRICITLRITHICSQYYSLVDKGNGTFDVFEEGHDYYMADNWDGDSKRSGGSFKGNLEQSKLRLSRTELEKFLGVQPRVVS